MKTAQRSAAGFQRRLSNQFTVRLVYRARNYAVLRMTARRGAHTASSRVTDSGPRRPRRHAAPPHVAGDYQNGGTANERSPFTSQNSFRDDGKTKKRLIYAALWAAWRLAAEGRGEWEKFVNDAM